MAGKVTINIASAAALYKKLVTSTEGYVGEAPIIHQAVALKAAIDAMDTAFAEDRDANFWPGSGRIARPSDSLCIGRCGATNCAIPVCARTRRRRTPTAATTARLTGWTPPNARSKDC